MTTSEEYPSNFTTIIAIVLFVENIIALILNISVLIVFHLSKRTLDSDSNSFITSLNVLDIIVSLTTVPMTTALLLTSRHQTKIFCYFHEASISFASSASATNLLVISLDRYDVILYPFNRHLTPKKVKYIVTLIWIISWFGFCTPFYGYGFSNDENSAVLPCAKWFHISRVNNYYYELYYVLIYIISNAVMIICYWQIFRQSRKNRLHFRQTLVKLTFINADGQQQSQGQGQGQGHSHDHASKGRLENERKLTKVSMTIVISFMCCWGPHAVLSIVLVCISEHTKTLEMLQIAFLALAYFSGLLHPMLYAFMRKNFRDALAAKLRSRSGSKVVPLNPDLLHRRMSSVSRRSSSEHNGIRRNTLSSDETALTAATRRELGIFRPSSGAEQRRATVHIHTPPRTTLAVDDPLEKESSSSSANNVQKSMLPTVVSE